MGGTMPMAEWRRCWLYHLLTHMAMCWRAWALVVQRCWPMNSCCNVEKNKHKDKRMKTARGQPGKAIVAGVRDRATKQIAARVVADTKAGT